MWKQRRGDQHALGEPVSRSTASSMRVPRVAGCTELAARIHARAVERWGAGTCPAMIGLHPKFTSVLDRLERFAECDSPVLISGETGTGKELFARALYLLSRRSSSPFLRVNCAQYQEGQLIASELFGHKKGSFTGAASDHVGVIEAAHKGMVFLDEVAELTPSGQAMMLRALSEGEIVPVGDTRARQIEVRVVAASNGDLRAMVESGSFRADLYYRLRGVHLHVPPVRERGQDWELLREHHLQTLSAARGQRKRFTSESLDVLGRHAWPGNVRELKALVDTGFHLSDGDLIEPVHFLECLEEVTRRAQIEKVPTVDAPVQCYERMRAEGGSFWEVVHGPYMDRELSRSQVRLIVARGLTATRGNYKNLLPLFGMGDHDYLRFMDFLRHHRLKPEA